MIRKLLLAWMFAFSAVAANAQVSIGIGLPHVTIGINLPVYPELVPVPGYPVYYAPRLDSNYFFYDGLYWVYLDDHWYASSWYNGPWWVVAAIDVPVFILRVPVRYYRRPPPYFHGWHAHEPPHWGEHWGRDWAQRRSGWDHWNRKSVPPPAPLPVYQRQYSGDRYPGVEQQRELRSRNYRYQPRDAKVRQHYQAPSPQRAPPQVHEQRSPQVQQREAGPRQRPDPYDRGREARVQEQERGSARDPGRRHDRENRGRDNDRDREDPGGGRGHERGR
jgi:hypothetical protein